MNRTPKLKIKTNPGPLNGERGSIRWKSSDGTIQYIEEMADKHLENTIRFLCKISNDVELAWDVAQIMIKELQRRESIEPFRTREEAKKFGLAEALANTHYDCMLNEMKPLNFHE